MIGSRVRSARADNSDGDVKDIIFRVRDDRTFRLVIYLAFKLPARELPLHAHSTHVLCLNEASFNSFAARTWFTSRHALREIALSPANLDSSPLLRIRCELEMNLLAMRTPREIKSALLVIAE